MKGEKGVKGGHFTESVGRVVTLGNQAALLLRRDDTGLRSAVKARRKDLAAM